MLADFSSLTTQAMPPSTFVGMRDSLGSLLVYECVFATFNGDAALYVVADVAEWRAGSSNNLGVVYTNS
jgi:hypothetical protein